jgi:hypothetical protein
MSKSERQVVENMDDIFRFVRRSHISKKNVARLEQTAKSENPQVASLARNCSEGRLGEAR